MGENNNNALEYQLIPGFRSTSNLLYIASENQIYKYKYAKNNTKYFVCYEKQCPVNIAVDFNNSLFCRKTKNNVQHNHGSQEALVQKLELVNNIKKNCQNISLKRSNIREVFNETCKKHKGDNTSVKFGQMRRHLYKIKNKNFPKAPTNFKEIKEILENETEMIKTFAISRKEENEKFYKNTIIEQNYAYSIFLSPTICKLIGNLRLIY